MKERETWWSFQAPITSFDKRQGTILLLPPEGRQRDKIVVHLASQGCVQTIDLMEFLT